MYNFDNKLAPNWTVLGLHLILGPQEVTQLIGSTSDMNPITQCGVMHPSYGNSFSKLCLVY